MESYILKLLSEFEIGVRRGSEKLVDERELSLRYWQTSCLCPG